MGHRASTCHLLMILPVCIILFVVASVEVACLMMSEPYTDAVEEDDESGPEKSQTSDCELQDCLELYQAAQDSMQPRHHSASALSPSSTDLHNAAHCTVLRTFSSCIRNMPTSCQGDLTFHSSRRVVQKQMQDLNCSQRGPVFKPPVAIPSSTGGSSASSDRHSNSLCVHRRATNHSFCTVFGDPHVRSFNGIHQTCRVIGTFPMLDNEFLSIQVTSEVINDNGASAVTKVTVVIKKHEECISERYVTYQAISPDPLPSTFENGLSSFGSSDAVRLVDVTSGQHVEIIVRHADTTVVLRQTGRYFSVSVRVPVDTIQMPVESIGAQLCVMKCPASDILSLSSMKPSSALNIADATDICRHHRLVDSFLDSCVFDLVVSGGDRNFTSAAMHALHDFRRLDPTGAVQLRNRTTFGSQSYEVSSSVPLSPSSFLEYLMVSMALVLLRAASHKVPDY